MLYAEILSDKHYAELYPELLSYLQSRFADIETGLQGDAWIWISEAGHKVALDTFTAMNFQLKGSADDLPLVEAVAEYLALRYELMIIDPPEPEASDDELH